MLTAGREALILSLEQTLNGPCITAIGGDRGAERAGVGKGVTDLARVAE